ncbi:nickel pincer cofactor biosynthesis protein LarC [Rothia sp. ARF10]|nr:nickel pincer cofactor biosynthesis protein LarC [Rothia sp. ARF10]
MTTHLWIDAGAGVAGDMLLGALVDAGAPLDEVQHVVDAVLPGTVRLSVTEVTRAGLRAAKLDVEVLVADQPHRQWSDIRERIVRAAIPEPVRDSAIRVFTALAEAEAAVHGNAVDEVHFHEVGAWDSVADVVGVAAALHLLAVTTVSAGPVALGSGTARTSHGLVGVPAPATLELAKGWDVAAVGEGELATPTGMALVRGLARLCEPLPRLRVTASGTGAGTKDVEGRANITRVVLGTPVGDAHPSDAPAVAAPLVAPTAKELWVLEANVDDLDPRLWPGVLEALLDGGAADAWLTPILMKKGRPAHTLSVLCTADLRAALRDTVLEHTTTLGVREHPVERFALGRSWETVLVRGHEVRVKISHSPDGRILHATPEFEDVRAAARADGIPARVVLGETNAVAQALRYPAADRRGQD